LVLDDPPNAGRRKGKRLAFGRSKASIQSGKKSKITFADVAGCERPKRNFCEIIEFLKDPAKFQRLGAKISEGRAALRRSWNRKNALAKAVAGEAGVPLLLIVRQRIVEIVLSWAPAACGPLFLIRAAKAPLLLFIDDNRCGRTSRLPVSAGAGARTNLNSWLVEMDGFDQRGRDLDSATNRPDVLDSRADCVRDVFDRQITVARPDLRGREEILRVHAKAIKMGPDVDLNQVAKERPVLWALIGERH